MLRVIAYDRPGHAYSITQFKTDLGSGGTAEAYSRGVPANPNIFVVRFATSCTLGMANSERPPLRPSTAGGAAVTGMKFGFFFGLAIHVYIRQGFKHIMHMYSEFIFLAKEVAELTCSLGVRRSIPYLRLGIWSTHGRSQ